MSEISKDEIHDGKTSRTWKAVEPSLTIWSYKQGTIVGRKAAACCSAGFMPTQATLLHVTIN